MEVIVLKEGIHADHFDVELPLVNVVDPICSAVVLIKGEKNILVDPGNFGFEEEILAQLSENGLKPEDIDYVLLTHSHFDHVSNMYLFKNSKLIRKGNVWYDKKVEVRKDNKVDIVEGVEEIQTPGHTPAHRSIVVKADKTYVVAGDAVQPHMLEKGFDDDPNKDDIIASYQKILDIADVIIPGHGKVIEGEDLVQLKQRVNTW